MAERERIDRTYARSVRRASTVLAWSALALIPIAVVALTIAVDNGTTPRARAPIGPGTTGPYVPVTAPPPAASPIDHFELRTIASGFDQPTDVAVAPGSDDLYVVEKTGKIWVVSAGTVLEEPFLDLTTYVDTYAERGLLDLVFHPDYQENRRFIVHYTNTDGDTRVVDYLAEDPHRADSTSARLVLAIVQPHYYHNGGRLQFGPDGYLWAGFGDGGGIGDSYDNGQNPNTLLAAIVRIDVDGAIPYAVPPDNPFVDGGGAPEVWAYGLRNPWRFFVDGTSGQIYIADVGQDTWEEVDVVPLDAPGANFGWSVKEGPACFRTTPCDGDFVEPVFTYQHQNSCAIIGGPVYRGSLIPELWGKFLYTDYCAGWVRALQVEDGAVVDEMEVLPPEIRTTTPTLTSFGVDADGEILALGTDGTLSRLVAVRAP